MGGRSVDTTPNQLPEAAVRSRRHLTMLSLGILLSLTLFSGLVLLPPLVGIPDYFGLEKAPPFDWTHSNFSNFIGASWWGFILAFSILAFLVWRGILDKGLLIILRITTIGSLLMVACNWAMWSWTITEIESQLRRWNRHGSIRHSLASHLVSGFLVAIGIAVLAGFAYRIQTRRTVNN